ncbi:hypothetical protein ACOMICROBIO_FLGHMIGD_03898 [Vibrio sp. B1FLJ16]|nr:hypothetical protein ACOMICROBIO_FLGHMIGD_03898 [Vibrio sp. B1FLJ16]CAE6938459.1 hypothetical protein ACOMICROBIO_FLGHMIGD_03898 [Vibrio sp. B1FLJ16]
MWNWSEDRWGGTLRRIKLTTFLVQFMLEKENLIKLARTQMPFGKYAGRVLIDLPEEYLLWFDKKGWPSGELGDLLKLCLALKIEGLDSVVKPLKRM